MDLHNINPNVADARARRNWENLRLTITEVDGDMMRLSVYDVDEDGQVALAAGGTELDLSAFAKGSILAANAIGALSVVTSTTENDVPALQADGTIAWTAMTGVVGDLENLLLTDVGGVVVTDAEGDICYIDR